MRADVNGPLHPQGERELPTFDDCMDYDFENDAARDAGPEHDMLKAGDILYRPGEWGCPTCLHNSRENALDPR